MKAEHSYLVKEQLCISITLEEKVDIVECDICPILKLEIENLKRQLTHIIKSPNIISLVPNDKGKNLRKNNKKKPYVIRKDINNRPSKVKCHYCGDEDHTTSLC